MERRTKTKCRTIVETLEDEILAGRYKSPAAFPSVARIVRRFGVAHLTAVKVLDELKKMGLIRSRQGAGTFVAPTAGRSVGLIVPAWQGSEFFPALAAELASLGFERMSIYKYLADDTSPGRWTLPRDFGQVVATSLAHWRYVHGTSPIKFFPSLSTGYDPRPWIGAVNNAFVTNVTSRGFRRICEDARRFSDETGERYLLVGPLDEWGEGSIGYPNRQHGFGMLEAVRDTFGEKPADGWPVNIAPEDVGLKCPSRKEQ